MVDLMRDDTSLLSNGPLGWIQLANVVITGLMVIACAFGVRRALGSGPAATWAPRLLALYGAGLIATGIFVADPMSGFPPSAPAGRPSTVSFHGLMHITAAGLAFLCLIADCFVLARRFAALGQRRWAAFSRVTGALFLVGFGGVASGSFSPAVVLGFWLALLVVWAWLGVSPSTSTVPRPLALVQPFARKVPFPRRSVSRHPGPGYRAIPRRIVRQRRAVESLTVGVP